MIRRPAPAKMPHWLTFIGRTLGREITGSLVGEGVHRWYLKILGYTVTISDYSGAETLPAAANGDPVAVSWSVWIGSARRARYGRGVVFDRARLHDLWFDVLHPEIPNQSLTAVSGGIELMPPAKFSGGLLNLKISNRGPVPASGAVMIAGNPHWSSSVEYEKLEAGKSITVAIADFPGGLRPGDRYEVRQLIWGSLPVAPARHARLYGEPEWNAVS